MNRLKEIKELKALAEKLQLENREIIRKYNMRELCSIYNGMRPGFLSRMVARACFRPASEPRGRGVYTRHRGATRGCLK